MAEFYLRFEPTLHMVRQELEMSCGAACARQLLLDAQIPVSEATIRDLAKFDPAFAYLGISAEALASALESLHVGAEYSHGGVDPEALELLSQRVPFIALLSTPTPHYIIVDEIGAEQLRVRDPAGTNQELSMGAAGIIRREVFMDRWFRAGLCVVFRKK